MAERPPNRKADIASARSHLEDLVDVAASGDERIVIARDGTPVAALVSTADLARWLAMHAERAKRFEPIEHLREELADILNEELEREVTKAFGEARLARRSRMDAQNEHALALLERVRTGSGISDEEHEREATQAFEDARARQRSLPAIGDSAAS